MEPYFPPTPGGLWTTGIELRHHGMVSLIQDRPLDSRLDQDKIAREILRTIGLSTADRELDLYFPHRQRTCPERGLVAERCPTLDLLEAIAQHRNTRREVGV